MDGVLGAESACLDVPSTAVPKPNPSTSRRENIFFIGRSSDSIPLYVIIVSLQRNLTIVINTASIFGGHSLDFFPAILCAAGYATVFACDIRALIALHFLSARQ